MKKTTIWFLYIYLATSQFLAAEDLAFSDLRSSIKTHFPAIDLVITNSCENAICLVEIRHATVAEIVYATGEIPLNADLSVGALEQERNARIYSMAEVCAARLRRSTVTLRVRFLDGTHAVLARSIVLPRTHDYCESGISAGEQGQIIEFSAVTDETSVTIYHSKENN